MRNAAHRRDSEAPPEPPSRDQLVAAALADAAAWAGRRNALIARLEAEPGNDRLVNELIIACIRTAENTAALEDCTAGESVVEAVDRAAYARGWADREAAGRQPSRPRHAARGHLRGLPGVPATAARTAVASVVVAAGLGGGLAAMHDESSVAAVAASPAGHAVLRQMAPDRAAVIPPSPSPRPSAAAASARPAPAVTPSVPVTSPPPVPVPSAPSGPPPVTAPAGPVLVAPGLLDLAGSHFGHLPLSVDGPGEVAWTATATDGIRLQQSAGVVVAGQTVEIRVDDLTGDGGWIYFSAGSQALAVHVMPLGAPAVAMP